MIDINEIETEIANVEMKLSSLKENIDTNETQQLARHVKLELGNRVLQNLKETKQVLIDVNDKLGSI
jgi:hypothetical protein